MTPLHQVGQAIREALQAVPLWGVRLLFLVTLLTVLIWVLRLPQSEVTPPGGAKRWDENLKYGAAFALLIQLIVYSIF